MSCTNILLLFPYVEASDGDHGKVEHSVPAQHVLNMHSQVGLSVPAQHVLKYAYTETVEHPDPAQHVLKYALTG
jgi:hypothetical protein